MVASGSPIQSKSLVRIFQAVEIFKEREQVKRLFVWKSSQPNLYLLVQKPHLGKIHQKSLAVFSYVATYGIIPSIKHEECISQKTSRFSTGLFKVEIVSGRHRLKQWVFNSFHLFNRLFGSIQLTLVHRYGRLPEKLPFIFF